MSTVPSLRHEQVAQIIPSGGDSAMLEARRAHRHIREDGNRFLLHELTDARAPTYR